MKTSDFDIERFLFFLLASLSMQELSICRALNTEKELMMVPCRHYLLSYMVLLEILKCNVCIEKAGLAMGLPTV